MGEQEKKPSGTASDGSSKKKWSNRRKRHRNKSNVTPAVKLRGGKEELDGTYFDSTGYGQSDRFMKTVQKIADHVGQEYKSGGVTRTEVMTQAHIKIPTPTRPVGTSVTAANGDVTITPPDILDISDYQSAKKIVDYQVQHQTKNCQKYSPLCSNNAPSPCMPRLRLIVIIKRLNRL